MLQSADVILASFFAQVAFTAICIGGTVIWDKKTSAAYQAEDEADKQAAAQAKKTNAVRGMTPSGRQRWCMQLSTPRWFNCTGHLWLMS